MPDRFLAVCLWMAAWLLIDLTIIGAYISVCERKRALAAATVAAGGFMIAVLANAGTDLW